VLVGAMCRVESVQAAQFDYNLGYRAEYSDNVTRVADDQFAVEELIHTTSAGFTFLENTSALNARVHGSAAYNAYNNRTFDNQTTYLLDAYGEFFVASNTLSWVAADGFRSLLIDPQTPDTPNNRQNSNVWATGPNLGLRLSSVDTLGLEGRYGHSWVENLDLDNDRTSYAARWVHRLSERTRLSLNYEYLNVEFTENPAIPDITRHNYFLRTGIHDLRNTFVLDLGRTSIERDGFEPHRNWLVHLLLSRQSGSFSSLGMHLRREYSDTGGELLPAATPTPAAGAGAAPLGADVVTGEPFYLTHADVFYNHRGSAFPWLLRAIYRDVDYENENLPVNNDRQEKAVQLDVRYQLSGTVTLQFLGTYTILAFEEPSREDRDSNAGFIVSYRMTPHIQTALDLRQFTRQSTAVNQDYTDNRVALSIIYGSRPSGR